MPSEVRALLALVVVPRTHVVTCVHPPQTQTAAMYCTVASTVMSAAWIPSLAPATTAGTALTTTCAATAMRRGSSSTRPSTRSRM